MKMEKAVPVWVLSLGCPKNRVDTERLLGSLGFAVKTATHVGKSRLVFINTCAFIEPAARESIRAILDAIRHIEKLKHKPLLAVAGCLVGRYGRTELAKELPEVDIWLSTDNLEQWPALVAKAMGSGAPADRGRISQDGLPYAWLKIGDGCQHKCAFCTIPSIKGGWHSEPADKIITEAQSLLSKGVKELILVAQDIAAWGAELRAGTPHRLAGLVRQLALLPGLEWLRLLYIYPASITEEFLRVIADTGLPLLPYLDIPFQHSEQEILEGMGRPFAKDPRYVVEKVRKFLPDAALRTTLIVGYPGETETHFKNLCAFVEQTGFHNLGVFTYQPEDGTPAASMPNQLPDQVKEERKNIILEIQARVSQEILKEYVGSRMQVMVDADLSCQWPGLHAGRVWFQAPEVDGITYVSGPGVTTGAMVECDIVGSHTYDLDALA